MDIDTHVDGTHWWFTVYPDHGQPFEVHEDVYYALQGLQPRRCEAEVLGSHRGQQCPNYCEPGEYRCRDHPYLGTTL